MKWIAILFALMSNTLLAQHFTASERAHILSGDTTKQLRVTPLHEKEGERALRALSVDMAYNDPLLPLLKERMYKAVMNPDNRGVGIAAPQVGINRNLIWVKRFDKPGEPFEFYINPKIVWKSALLRRGMEGDLSFADKRGDVVRSYAIMLSYIDANGQQQLEMVEDFTAVIFQHEIDHLFGILLFDHLEAQKNIPYKPYQSSRPSTLLMAD